MTEPEINSNDIETTENLLKVLANYKDPEPVFPVIRVLYDEATGNVTSITHDTETTEPHIVISQEEYNWTINHWSLRVVNGKLEPAPPPEPPPVLQLAETPPADGATFKTTSDNMLVMGNDTGWNDANT